jgi:two-component system, sensor histidine kinase and response regulator
MALNVNPMSLTDHLPDILCIDSNELMLEIIANILAPLPVRCVTVSDPLAAIEQARRLCPRLLILDWQLPRMNGWEVLSAIRIEMRPASPRVIILSAGEGGFEQILAENVAGADAFLEKSFEIDSLSREISRLLAMPLPGSAAHV